MKEDFRLPKFALILDDLIKTGVPQDPPPPLVAPWDMLYRLISAMPDSNPQDRREAAVKAVIGHYDRARLSRMIQDTHRPDYEEVFTPPDYPPYRPAHFFADAGYSLYPHSPIQWLIKDFISRPSLTLVVGEASSKKTYAILDLATCIALGKPWLDHPLHQAPVTWCDSESGPHRLFTRIGQSLRAHDAPSDIPFRVSVPNSFDFGDKMHRDQLEFDMKHREAGLLVIDPLTSFIDGIYDTSHYHSLAIFDFFRELSDKLNIAIIIIHHAGRSGAYRGASHLINTVDLMLQVRSNPNTPYIVFKTLKTRDTFPRHFAAQIHFDPPEPTQEAPQPERAWLTSANLTQAFLRINRRMTFSQIDEHILSHLAAHGSCSADAIIQAAPECTPKQIRNAIFKLKTNGCIERSDNGGKGKTAAYVLNHNSPPFI